MVRQKEPVYPPTFIAEDSNEDKKILFVKSLALQVGRNKLITGFQIVKNGLPLGHNYIVGESIESLSKRQFNKKIRSIYMNVGDKTFILSKQPLIVGINNEISTMSGYYDEDLRHDSMNECDAIADKKVISATEIYDFGNKFAIKKPKPNGIGVQKALLSYATRYFW